MSEQLNGNNLKHDRTMSFFSNFSWEKFLLDVIMFYSCLALFTPVVFSESFFFPAIVPKTIFFRIAVDIILIAYVFLITFAPAYRPKTTKLTLVVGLFLGVLFLTSLTGVNFGKSFWGNFERMDGLLTFFHLFGFYLVLSNVFKKREDWEKLFTVSILVSLLTVLLIAVTKDFTIANGGSLGNSSFFASYLVFNIFLSLILFLIKNIKWKIFYGISLLISIPALAMSGCKGAIIAFFAGLFLLILSYLMFFKRKILIKFIIPVFLFLLVSSAVFLTLRFNFVKNETKTILENPTLQARLIVWQMSWQGWKEKLIFGWGPENFDILFYKHFNPHLALNSYGGEVFFDRAHNIILDIGTTSGLVGLLSYLAIFAVAFCVLFKTYKNSLNKKEFIVFAGVSALLMSYFVQNLLLFDIINTYMMFFLILAFVSFFSQNNKPTDDGYQKKIPLLFGMTLAVIILFILYFGNIQPAKASFYIIQGIDAQLKESISLFQKAIKTSPMGQTETVGKFSQYVHFSLSDMYANKNDLNNGLKTVTQEMQKIISKNPEDFYLYLQLGTNYNDFYQFNGDKESLVLAENMFKKAIPLSPKNQAGYWELANNMYLQGKHQVQFEYLQKAIDLEPNLGMSHWYLAMAYNSAGEEELAKTKTAELRKKEFNWQEKTKELKELMHFYSRWNDNFNALFIFYTILNNHPNIAIDYQASVQEFLKYNPQGSDDVWFALAIAMIHDNLGEKEKAKEAFKKAYDIDPNLANQVETFFKISEN